MQNNVVQPNVNEVKRCQSTRTMPQPQQKKVSFSFTSLLSNVLQLLPYMIIYLQKGWGGKGAMHDSCLLFFKGKKKKRREEIRIRKKIKKRKDTLHLIKEKILCI